LLSQLLKLSGAILSFHLPGQAPSGLSVPIAA
jgi:hypothetical protein